MTGWIILAAVVLLLAALSLVRLGGRAVYGPEGFSAFVLAGPVKIRLYPAKPKDRQKPPKKEKPGKKPREKEPSKPDGEDGPGTLSRVRQLLPVLAEAAGALKWKIRIDRLDLTVIWGAEDAASAALGYGKAQAFLGMIWPLIDHNFNVKHCDWNVEVDYHRPKPQFAADAALTLTVGQLVSFAVRYGVKLLKSWSRSGDARTNKRRHHYE